MFISFKHDTSDRKRLLISILASLLLILSVLFSAFYLVAEADHDCAGRDCPVCACIQQCANTLKQIRTTLAGHFLPAVLTAAVALLTWIFCGHLFSRTLVSQKIRLNR